LLKVVLNTHIIVYYTPILYLCDAYH